MEDVKTWYEQISGAFYQGNPGLEFSVGDIMSTLFSYSLLGIPNKLNFKEQRNLKKQLLEQLDEMIRTMEDEIRKNYHMVEKLHENLKHSQKEKNA
jgi:hypothetical protein